MNKDIAYLRNMIQKSDRIVAFTGAGISTESGIPDFRGPEGLWTKNPEMEKLSNINESIKNPEIRMKSWNAYTNRGFLDAKPNKGHLALKKLFDTNKLRSIITQNVDGLHQKAGIPDVFVDELHGSLTTVKCTGCDWSETLEEIETHSVKENIPIHESICPMCSSNLKPGIIMFGELLSADIWLHAESAAMGCSLMLVLGSSLTVYPAADLVNLASSMGADIVIVNNNVTDFDRHAELIIREPIGNVLDAVC